MYSGNKFIELLEVHADTNGEVIKSYLKENPDCFWRPDAGLYRTTDGKDRSLLNNQADNLTNFCNLPPLAARAMLYDFFIYWIQKNSKYNASLAAGHLLLHTMLRTGGKLPLVDKLPLILPNLNRYCYFKMIDDQLQYGSSSSRHYYNLFDTGMIITDKLLRYAHKLDDFCIDDRGKYLKEF